MGACILDVRIAPQLQQLDVDHNLVMLSWHSRGPWLAVGCGEEVLLLETPLGLPKETDHRINWHPSARLRFPGIVAVTGLAWEADASALCFGTARGSIERLRTFRQKLKGKCTEVFVTLCNSVRIFE